MRWVVLLVIQIAICEATTHSLLSRGFCSSSPLQPTNEETSCLLTKTRRKTSHGKPLKSASERAANESSWSEPQHCTQNYCVFANRHFGHGVALVTTSDSARRVLKLDGISDSSTAQPPPFYATNIPSKGIGLIANRSISRGERLIAAKPVLLLHKTSLGILSSEEQIRLLDLAVQKLPAASRRAFTGQMGSSLTDKLLTNSFQIDLGGDGGSGHHLGSFPEVSRLNHDCRPNLAFYVDANLTHHTRAVRDIAAGEELTINYANPLDDYAARQSRLRSGLGFTCQCAQCSLGATERDRSDANVAAIVEIEVELGNFNSKVASVAMVERLLGLYDEERLESKIAGAYTLAALNYALFGKEKKAREYALRAAEAVEMEIGWDAADVEAMKGLAKNPKVHWSWKGRLRH